MKIVVIEDSPDIMDVVDCILSSDGHQLFPCTDGSIAGNLHNINPDLIFIDEFLPVKRGSEICKHIKANPRLKHLPVILISTIPHLEKLAKDSGADGFLEKPFELTDFMAFTRRFAKV